MIPRPGRPAEVQTEVGRSTELQRRLTDDKEDTVLGRFDLRFPSTFQIPRR